MNVGKLLLVGGVLVLAGCQTVTDLGLRPATRTATQPDAQVDAQAKAVANIATLQAPLFDTLPPAPPPAPINDDPNQVLGLPTGSLNALLGAPKFVRRDLAAEVWQYRADGCVLDVFLYDREAFGVAEVVHFEVRPNQIAAKPMPERAQRSCFVKLLQQHDTAAG